MNGDGRIALVGVVMLGLIALAGTAGIAANSLYGVQPPSGLAAIVGSCVGGIAGYLTQGRQVIKESK